jgi:hypothetical protein
MISTARQTEQVDNALQGGDRPKPWEINLLPLLPAAVVPPVHGEAVYRGGLASGPPQSSGARSVLR